ncbi:MAG: hypothetical protein HWN68_04000 [Desulfobacterales bacterium]|nr:hypothetical protein [Desulfobacterales bacterium]
MREKGLVRINDLGGKLTELADSNVRGTLVQQNKFSLVTGDLPHAFL